MKVNSTTSHSIYLTWNPTYKQPEFIRFQVMYGIIHCSNCSVNVNVPAYKYVRGSTKKVTQLNGVVTKLKDLKSGKSYFVSITLFFFRSFIQQKFCHKTYCYVVFYYDKSQFITKKVQLKINVVVVRCLYNFNIFSYYITILVNFKQTFFYRCVYLIPIKTQRMFWPFNALL